MANYVNPAEKAYKEGRSSISAEEAVGLRGGVATPKKSVSRAYYLRWLRRVMGKIGKRETGTEMARGAGGLGR